MKKWLLRKWDWWIYRRAVRSIERIGQSDPAYVHLMKHSLQDWCDEHPLPVSLRTATERFHIAMRQHMSNAEYKHMTERGSQAWKDVPNASRWVDELRGSSGD